MSYRTLIVNGVKSQIFIPDNGDSEEDIRKDRANLIFNEQSESSGSLTIQVKQTYNNSERIYIKDKFVQNLIEDKIITIPNLNSGDIVNIKSMGLNLDQFQNVIGWKFSSINADLLAESNTSLSFGLNKFPAVIVVGRDYKS